MFNKHRLPVKLTDDKRAELEKRNADIDINMLVAAEELERAKAIYKEATEGIKKEKSINLQTLRQGYQLLDVEALEYVDEDQGTIQYLDEEGVLIHERTLSLEERRQYRIQFGRKQLAD